MSPYSLEVTKFMHDCNIVEELICDYCDCNHKCCIHRVKYLREKKGYTKSNFKSEYSIWASMRQRCSNPKNTEYLNYGGRGISVCTDWMCSFELFMEDMGPRPGTEYSIERKDNDLGYYPNNCKWGTKFEQARNRSSCNYVSYQGRLVTLIELSELTNIPYYALKNRIRRGDSGEYLTRDYTPSFKYRYGNGEYTLSELSKLTGISSSALWKRVKSQGMTVDEAIARGNGRSGVNNNTIVNYQSNDISIQKLSDLTGIDIKTLLSRYRKYRSGEDIVSPSPGSPSYVYKGNEYTILELSRLSGIHPGTLFRRIYKLKMSVEDALKPIDLRGQMKEGETLTDRLKSDKVWDSKIL